MILPVESAASLVPDDFVARLARRADEAERLRRLPDDTVAEVRAGELLGLLAPKRFGGRQASFPEVLEPVQRMALGCASSAWTIGFFVLHNWLLSLFDEQAQVEVFASGPVLAPAPLAPTGFGEKVSGGIKLSGKWSWATGIMHADWVMVCALCGSGDDMFPGLVLVPADQVSVDDVWHTLGMRATGSNDVTITDVFVPEHRIVPLSDIYNGTSAGAALHDAALYRWPVVPALALTAAMPILGSAQLVVNAFAERLETRVLAYSGVKQKEQPATQIRLADARIRLQALQGLVTDIAGTIESIVADGGIVQRKLRARARATAAHVVNESLCVINNLMAASGASANFLANPLQRARRDAEMGAGHVIFDQDVARELYGALEIGMKISPIAMV
ncbi:MULTISPECIES: acyl-CoA dehydrogenase [Mycobacterium]|uniref:Acyl-CoA dehydrogenase n=1 Tax=Mycobacterium kiyosense TaxID=2871094 RepID=A0AA37V4W3_9MYCO|nr:MULTISPECIES: acyl-CoA dehydrogenase [Mycobacterium]BDE12815.1 acyl-CoA dehydrogenase [Mycobacterium sp. 20KCMC460]GLB82489.1 acyl-CoA dehydrogenase [Mycobacterium kiyosense]GLB90306.1 acyl-CoA dehydrogenase [Mycobacterium kiyosense]GLB93909.1 acyl-CoA dehydrogenase [Mycobacterium kiyosense]GLC00632.1 acyl-CoA dehydrogenase [Mycobacterium kiyosense]